MALVKAKLTIFWDQTKMSGFKSRRLSKRGQKLAHLNGLIQSKTNDFLCLYENVVFPRNSGKFCLMLTVDFHS